MSSVHLKTAWANPFIFSEKSKYLQMVYGWKQNSYHTELLFSFSDCLPSVLCERLMKEIAGYDHVLFFFYRLSS